jgi:putative ABC transport system permease protein
MEAGREFRFAVRTLAKTPGFVLTCVLVLSLGIAVSTAVFSVVMTMIKRPLPFPDPERLAVIRERNLEKGFSAQPSYATFANWRDRSTLFQELGATAPVAFNLSSGSEPESVGGALATADFFRSLGWKTLLGRSFAAEDELAGGSRVVLISQRCWERRFGSDPVIIGTKIAVDGQSATVIGVLRRIIGRSYYASYEVWAPLARPMDPASRKERRLEVVGLLKPGEGFARAGAQLDAISRATAESETGTAGWGAQVVPMTQIMAHAVPMYFVLLTITILLLLIVCANIAMLQLARVSGRQAEIAVRIALGATRPQIVRHLLGEGILLAGTGGGLGFLLAAGLRQVLVASVPELAELRLDTAALGFTALVSIAVGLLFGLSPALSASKPDLSGLLKSGGSLPAKAGGRMRFVLVAGEMAVTVTLLTGLGLLVRTFLSLHHAETGFRTENLVTASVTLPKEHAGPQNSTAFFRLAAERLRSVAGVESAAAVSAMPLAGGGRPLQVEIEGRANVENLQGHYTVATPEHFRTMGIGLQRGRSFGPADHAVAPAVVIVNQRAAGLFWPGLDPIGKRVRLSGGEWRSVIAVANDVRQDLMRAAAPEFYIPHAQDPVPSMWMVARTRTDARQLIASLRTELRALEPGLRVAAPLTIDEVISGYFPGALVVGAGAFCTAALFFAMLGLYGVVSYLVTRRTHEFGVRIALGAGSGDVRRLVLAQGFKLAGAGAVIGLAGGFGLARLLAGLLVGVEVTHPLVFVAVAAVLSAVVLSACWLPVRRAMRISPMDALRCR